MPGRDHRFPNDTLDKIAAIKASGRPLTCDRSGYGGKEWIEEQFSGLD